MATGVLVAVANHCRQRRGLASTGRPDEQHQPPLGQRQLLQHVGQFEVFERGDVGLDPPQDHAGEVALVERTDPETPDPPSADGEIALVVLGELATLLLVHHPMHGFAGHLRRHRRLADRHDLAVDLHRRRHAGRDEQVGAALLHHQAQQFLEFHLADSQSSGEAASCGTWRPGGRAAGPIRYFPGSWLSRGRSRG